MEGLFYCLGNFMVKTFAVALPKSEMAPWLEGTKVENNRQKLKGLEALPKGAECAAGSSA